MNFLFECVYVCVCEGVLVWKIVKIMVTVLNIFYYMISMVFWCCCCCCACFGPIKITLSNYLKPMFCFLVSLIIFLRTAERIFHRVSYKLEQNVCVLPLLLACFVALWLPYKYFFLFCFPYVCFLKKQMSTNFRSIFAFVRLNDYFFPTVVCFCYLRHRMLW